MIASHGSARRPSLVARALVCAAVASLAFASSGVARAEQPWDVGFEAGAMRRILAQRPYFANDARLGPVAILKVHLAASPTFSFGVYGSFDISPEGGVPVRRVFSGGVRLRLMPAWPTDRVRAYFFVGAGFAGIHQDAHVERFPIAPTPGLQDVSVDAQSGTFFEIPFGLGVTYAFAPHWRISTELGGRGNFGFSSGFYGNCEPSPPPSASGCEPPRTGTAKNFPDLELGPLGSDAFAVALTVGVAYFR